MGMNDIGNKITEKMGRYDADISWLKKELEEIKEMLSANHEDIMTHMQRLETRVDKLEEFQSRLKGGLVVIGAICGSSLFVYFIIKLVGG